MRKPTSQNRRLLRELLVHKEGMTSMEIIKKVGTVNPTRNVDDLRKQGHRIVSRMRADGHKAFYLEA